MSHVRTQVRDAVGSILDASPVSWKRVFNTRLSPSRDITPYLMVWIETETIGASTIHDTATQEREMGLTVVARYRVTEGEAMEEALDVMAAEIETTLTSTALRSELSNNSVWLTLKASTSDLQVEEEDERVFAQIALEWDVLLFTEENAPETIV